MTARSVVHSRFTVERTYARPASEVFAAWAEPSAKRQWFADTDEWVLEDYVLDFRVGGKEHARGRQQAGPLIQYGASYVDIVESERIVYTYEMRVDDSLASVSVGTVELAPEGSGTRLIYTEQGAFFDGLDNARERETGTRSLLRQLDAYLRHAARR
jgi:uncharacterized protein YndB with AHSA1/START domain